MVSITMDEVETAQKIFPPIKTWPPRTLLSLALSWLTGTSRLRIYFISQWVPTFSMDMTGPLTQVSCMP